MEGYLAAGRSLMKRVGLLEREDRMGWKSKAAVDAGALAARERDEHVALLLFLMLAFARAEQSLPALLTVCTVDIDTDGEAASAMESRRVASAKNG